MSTIRKWNFSQAFKLATATQIFHEPTLEIKTCNTYKKRFNSPDCRLGFSHKCPTCEKPQIKICGKE